MAFVDAPRIVAKWSSWWPLGTSPAVSSVLDVLAGDVLEMEGRLRGEDPLVIGRDRIDAEAFRHWTLDLPDGPRGGFAGLFDRGPSRLLARVRVLGNEGSARRAAFAPALGSVEPVEWKARADMEVVSLAMGHLGPDRQGSVLPVVEGALVATAAAIAAAMLLERDDSRSQVVQDIAALGSTCAASYEPDVRALARLSASAFDELARRATAKGVKHAGPWSLPVRAWIPLLAAP